METLLKEINSKLSDLIENTNKDDVSDVKRTMNYLSALSYHIDSINKEKDFLLTEEQMNKLKRGRVVWVDFGFNIGKEFGGKHPAIILKATSNYQSLTVLPVDSQDDDDIEVIERRRKKEYWYEIPHINGMKKKTRWTNVYRVTEISSIRVDFDSPSHMYIKYEILDELDFLIEKFQYKPKYTKNYCAK